MEAEATTTQAVQRSEGIALGWVDWWKRAGLLIVCSIVPALASVIGVWDGMQWWSPAPLLSMVWLFLLDHFFPGYVDGALIYFTPPVAMVCFIALSAPIIANRSLTRLPLRSLILLTIFSITSLVWIGTGVFVTEGYQSSSYVILTTIANVIALAGLWASWFLFRNKFNTIRILLWNMAMVSWLFWLAHPWLGEYP